MMGIAAQVSLYPLRQDHLSPAIGEVVRTFQEHGLEARMGPMSTLVWGDDEEVFAALKEGFRRAAVRGGDGDGGYPFQCLSSAGGMNVRYDMGGCPVTNAD